MDPECLTVHYESFVQNPVRELAALCDRLRPAPDDAIRYAIQANSMESVRKLNMNQHCWQGNPGHWKHLLPAQESRQIAAHHSAVLATLGYTCDPDPDLSGEQADANWCALEFGSLWEECRLARAEVRSLQSPFEALQSQVAELLAANRELSIQLEAIRADRWSPTFVARKARGVVRCAMSAAGLFH